MKEFPFWVKNWQIDKKSLLKVYFSTYGQMSNYEIYGKNKMEVSWYKHDVTQLC